MVVRCRAGGGQHVLLLLLLHLQGTSGAGCNWKMLFDNECASTGGAGFGLKVGRVSFECMQFVGGTA